MAGTSLVFAGPEPLLDLRGPLQNVYSERFTNHAERAARAELGGLPGQRGMRPRANNNATQVFTEVLNGLGRGTDRDLQALGDDFANAAPGYDSDPLGVDSAYASQLTSLSDTERRGFLKALAQYLHNISGASGSAEPLERSLNVAEVQAFARNSPNASHGVLGEIAARRGPAGEAGLRLAVFAIWWLVRRGALLARGSRRQREMSQAAMADDAALGAGATLIANNVDALGEVFAGSIARYSVLMQHVQRSLNGLQASPGEYSDAARVCDSAAGNADGLLVDQLTAAQRFLVRYYKYHLPTKGLIAWWSPGAGKTCMAAAVASVNFESNDYATLWVTRGVLAHDLYDAVFGRTACHLGAREAGIVPEGHGKDARGQLELLQANTNWLNTLSYWTFGNYCEQARNVRRSNEYERVYREKFGSLAAARLAQDRLHRMFIVIDEAHMIYAERSDEKHVQTEAMENAIYHSYEASGGNSCRLLLLTASPLTRHPVDLLRLLSLCQPDPALRFNVTESEFDAKYFPAGSSASNAFLNNEVLPRVGALTFGSLSYLNVTGIPPVFPVFRRVQTIFVPASKPQIAQAVKCAGGSTLDVAKCLKRTDLAIDQVLDLAYDTSWSAVRANAQLYKAHLFMFAPKVHALVHAIRQRNDADYARHGHLFKHVVYLDFEHERFVKALVTIFRLFGFALGMHYDATGLHLASAATLRRDAGNSVTHSLGDPRYAPRGAAGASGVPDEAMARDLADAELVGPSIGFLVSGSVAGHKVDNSHNKKVLAWFNERTTYVDAGNQIVVSADDGRPRIGNEFGEFCQVLFMPKQFREGFSVLDTKYFWDLAPADSVFDGLQAVGRVTRQCGNRGLVRRLVAFATHRAGAGGRVPSASVPDPVRQGTSLEYTDLRSYLPLAIVSPSAVEARAAKVLDEINRSDTGGSGVHVPALAANPASAALNKATLIAADNINEPGTNTAFVGSQARYLELLYKLSLTNPRAYEAEVKRHEINTKDLAQMYFQPFYYRGERAPSSGKAPLRAARQRATSGPVVRQTLSKLQVDDKTLNLFVSTYVTQEGMWTMDQVYRPMFARRSYDLANALLLTAAAIFAVDYHHNREVNDPLYAPTSVSQYLTAGPVVKVPEPTDPGAVRPGVKPDTRDVGRPGFAVPGFQQPSHEALVVRDFTGQYSDKFAVPELEAAQRQRKSKQLEGRRQRHRRNE